MIRIKEGLSLKVYIIYSIIGTIFLLLIFGIILIFIPFDFFSNIGIVIFLICLCLLSSFVGGLLIGFRDQRIYILESGKISICMSRMFPFIGQTIYIDDIIECKKVETIPFFLYFNSKNRKYLTGFSSLFQTNICLITMKEDYKILYKGKIIHGPPAPDKPLGKLLYKKNPFYKRHFIIPVHVIESYIHEGYHFPCKIT